MKTELSSVECWEISYITTKVLSDSADAHQGAARLLHLLGTKLDGAFVAFWVLGVEPGLRCAAVWPEHDPLGDFAKVTMARTFRIGEGLPGRAWEARNVIWEPDVGKAPNFPRASGARGVGLKTGVAFPAFSNRSTLAVIELFAEEEHSPNQALMEFFHALGGQIGLFFQHFNMAETLAEAAGTLSAEQLVLTGTGSQNGHSRWGDYSSVSVDPVDDCTMWYTTEYLQTTGDFIWSTHVTHFELGTCQ